MNDPIREALAELEDAMNLEGFGCACVPYYTCHTCRARDVLEKTVRKPFDKLRAAIAAEQHGELPKPVIIGEIVGTRNHPEGTNEFWGYWAEGYKAINKVRVVDADQLRTAIAAERAENKRLRDACAAGWGEPALINTLRAELSILRQQLAEAGREWELRLSEGLGGCVRSEKE